MHKTPGALWGCTTINQSGWGRPLEQLKHLNNSHRRELLTTPTISLKHLQVAAPLAVWSPESYEKVLTEATENGHSAGWVAREKSNH